MRGFPFPALDTDEVAREFRVLAGVRPEHVLRRRRLRPSTIGLRLANSFHPQIWSIPAQKHAATPLDHFHDDATLRKLLERAARFWPNRRCWNAQCLRAMFRIYAGGRVSNFRPTAARALIDRYSKPGQRVLDFSAGFGGRLLGCLTLDRSYLGIDPALAQVTGLRNMLGALQPHAAARARIVHACAEDAVPRLDPESVDLVFSSPPYFDIEKYGDDHSQSYRRHGTYDAWRGGFLRPVIEASHRALKPGGHLVVNVANTTEYAIAHDLEAIARALFGERRILHLLMHSRPVQRASGAYHYRSEPVLVFRKAS